MNDGSVPLRLLFLSSIPRWGGGERWMLDAAAGLQARGHAVLVAARPGAQLLDRAREAGVPARRVRMGGDLDPRAVLGVRLLLWRHRPHAVFVNLDKELRYVCLATLAGRAPLVFARRGSDDPLKAGRLQRFTYRRLARLLTNSATLARTRFAAHPALPPDAVRVVPNGVPVHADLAPPGRTAMRHELRLPRNVALVLHIGELEARKGQETTLRALAALRSQQAPVSGAAGSLPVVAFIGTGPDEARLHVLSHELGVKDQVLWLGFRKDVERYLDAADLVVLPSRREGVPWTLLEALAHRVPVVASAVSGNPEVVRDGESGLLVPPDDPGALAAAMQKLLRDPELAARLAAAGHEAVRAHWNAESMLCDLECAVYAHLVARRREKSGAAGRAALFVDRDGTLVRNVPYNGDPAGVTLEPEVGRALRWVRDAGLPVIVVSNQSGVARGLYGEDAVHAVNARLAELLRAEGAEIEAFYFCPHHPQHGPACDCRKPQPGLLLRAAREHGIDLECSFMVGDAERDLEAGRRAGARALGYAGRDAGTGNASGETAGFPPGTRAYRDWMTLGRDVLRMLYARSLGGRP